MPKPTIIAGPAVVQLGGNTYYTEKDITVTLNRDTWKPETSMAGPIDERLSGQMFDIEFTPVGAHDVVAKYLPFALSNIGSLLFTGADCVIWTKGGQKITYGDAAITGLPKMKLSPLAQLFSGNMKITALADPTKELVDAAAYNAVTSVAFNDTSFDETLIRTPRYLAAIGALASPYDAIEPEDGFDFEIAMEIEMKTVANWGPVNAILKALSGRVAFVPANLTEAQIWTLMQVQGSDAILPGQSLSKLDQDIVITGGDASFTLHRAGPQTGTTRYGLTPLRPGEVAFVSRHAWTTGAAEPFFTIAFEAE